MVELAHASERINVDGAQVGTWSARLAGDDVKLSGRCPACRHETNAVVALQAAGLESAASDTPEELTVSVACLCRRAHPDRPDDGPAGCGRFWSLLLRIQPDAVTVSPANDRELDDASDAWREATTSQATSVRSAAEKWLAGITALYGLFGLASVGIARDSVAALPLSGRIAVGSAAAVAVCLAGWAVIDAYRAAYGWPVVTAVHDNDELRAWYAGRRAVGIRAARQLGAAVRKAAASLAALVIVVGLLWFVPPAPASEPLLQISRVDDSMVCGTVVTSRSPASLRLRRPGGETVVVPAGDIVAVKPVRSCPG
ncbi:hypothetical protein ONA70_22530 [Micromonospora yasonensis]|uniref:hypothetical protein n=1 Tax=Micromonospora yasonensis TaxID=1128667 RepID=UPI00222FFF24|nr:hypothetical protein [Micromonospora yasonensis]MCW3842879.1 hypothetical protein [Micromonospora yasonensis]